MAKPGADGIDVHAGENQVAGCCVPYHVRGYRSVGQLRRPGRATLDKAIDSEAGKRRSEPADKYGVIARATEDLVCQNSFGFRPQWTLARLAALSVQVGKIVTAIPAPDLQIAHLQLSCLGDTRPGVVAEARIRGGPAKATKLD